MSANTAKSAAAQKALDWIKPNMTVGLGTGSTAAFFIDHLGAAVREGLQIETVATSIASKKQALANGIEVVEADETTHIQVAVDGADEIDRNMHLIKGGGGALLREKIIAQAAETFIVIADQSKHVTALGAFALPVEIDPFCWGLTVQQVRQVLSAHGFDGQKVHLRGDEKGVFQSDGGHFILDCALDRIEDPAPLDAALRSLPGVVETGFFLEMADTVLLGQADGTVEKISR